MPDGLPPDLDCSDEEALRLSDDYWEGDPEDYGGGRWLHMSWTASGQGRANLYGLAGGFLFLGLFLGFIFLMATVLIIYYKQISEGYEDKRRFEIMQKVGLSREEVRAAIRGQVLMVFFLPILVRRSTSPSTSTWWRSSSPCSISTTPPSRPLHPGDAAGVLPGLRRGVPAHRPDLLQDR